MRYRGSGKIKKQHHIIKGLQEILETIESWSEINSIVPGEISRAKTGGKVKLRVSYKTESGIKAIARGHGAVQDVFLITDNSDSVLEKLQSSEFIV